MATVCIVVLLCAGCVMDSHDISHVVLGPKRQSIDTNVDHWISYAFSESSATVTMKVPPAFRAFSSRTLPALTYNAHSQRMLLDAEYDYRSRSIEDLAELEIRVSFIRLTRPLPTDPLDVDALDRALRIAEGRPAAQGDEPKPGLAVAAGLEWIHLDGTVSKFAETACETYGTLTDPTTLFLLSACYSGKMRLKPDWLESRRQLLRDIRDRVVVTPQTTDQHRPAAQPAGIAQVRRAAGMEEGAIAD